MEDLTPVEAVITPFYLGGDGRANSSLGDGRLGPQPEEASPADTYIYNPAEPVDGSGEREPENMRRHELRSDIVVYTSEPLLESFRSFS
ncbi:hypothetical protein [Paenibacillus sp. P32E]|uniref:hypothetical protein n=1 Tax=Paenibacillus sp. P32E TaxID=1349434 RepID=UPI00093908C9|nr:hypothetical protein [Paenibacillus sp. P32E]OKP88701.1 hypothetical protein A3848_17200 [Paenibacillus sp. P32E]